MSHTTPYFAPRSAMKISVLLLAGLLVAGCKKKEPSTELTPAQQQAMNQASQQAAATGQPQTITTTNAAGQQVTTTVQPPPVQSVTTTTTKTMADGTTQRTTVTTPMNPNGTGPQAQQGSSAGGPRPAAIQPINVPAGTTLSIRLNQHISVKTSSPGDQFTGSFAAPVVENGTEVIPKGTDVEGVIAAAHKRGRFKGASILELRLTSLTLNGQRYPLDTSDVTRTKKGKGKRSAALIGGGAGLGMLIGGLASGGTGLLIGGLAGGGAGTGVAAFTGNRDLDIPAESIVNFRLADPILIQP